MAQPRDIQFEIAAKVRQAGIRGDADVFLSRADAERVIDGLGIINSAIAAPEDIERYEGSQDHSGTLRYRLDPGLPRGVCGIEQRNRDRVLLSLSDVVD